MSINRQVAVAAVRASDFQAPHVPENTLDNDLDTRWSAEGDGQWIRYDLGALQRANEVRIAWHQGDQRQAHFDLEVSRDRSNWTEVFSGSSSGSILELEHYHFAEVTARYVRIIGHGNTQNDWNSITEVDIHRTDYLLPPPTTSCEISVSASSHDGHIPDNTLDGDLNTRWSAEGNGQWIRYDLGERRAVSEVSIAWHSGDKRRARFKIELLTNDSNWRVVFDGSSRGDTLQLERYRFRETTTRYVRIVGFGNTDNDWNSITEVVIGGCEAPPSL